MSRAVCYVTGARADFGLMRNTLLGIQQCQGLNLQLIVTGTHLVDRYGATVSDIDAAGLHSRVRVPIEVDPATGATMARNIGIMLQGFVDALERSRPDIVLLLGDRGEMLAGALAAIHLNIPTVHIHGGERSGTIDEPVRHAISKLAHFHLVATPGSRERLIRMGEIPEHVIVTGAPGLDGLTELASIPRGVLLREAGLSDARLVALMLFHPVLQEVDAIHAEVTAIVDALLESNLQVVALTPNSDAGGGVIRTVLERYSQSHGWHVATHFSRERFVSWMAAADVMIGNSSAGIIEAASFGTPVINVGSRQNLRERNSNVLDVPADSAALMVAIQTCRTYSRSQTENVYGDGQAASRIVNFLRDVPLPRSVLTKTNAY